MPETTQGPLSAGKGQSAGDPDKGTITAAPDADDKGQATGGTGGTSVTTPAQGQTEVFYDPKELEAALEGAPENIQNQVKALEKQLRGAFSKKTESIAKERQKIEAYNAFMSDPVGQLFKLATQYGLQVTKPGQRQPEPGGGDEDWQPKTWNEVFSKFKEQILQELQGDFKPVFDNITKLTASNIERQLDEIDADWRMYEDDMKANLQAHPSLVNDVSKLYRISVPDDVLQSRAVQKALKKVQDQVDASKLHSGKHTSRSEPAPKKAKSFDEAVQIARDQGKKEGWYR